MPKAVVELEDYQVDILKRLYNLEAKPKPKELGAALMEFYSDFNEVMKLLDKCYKEKGLDSN